MVNIPLFTRVSYKSGGFLAGISGCHQQEGSHIPDTSRHFFESMIFRFSLFSGICDASSPKGIPFGKGTLSFIEGSVYLSGN